MLGGARAGASEVPSHGSGEQFGGSFLAFGGRHRCLAGARLGYGWTNQGECSGLWMGGLWASTRHLAGDVSISRRHNVFHYSSMRPRPWEGRPTNVVVIYSWLQPNEDAIWTRIAGPRGGFVSDGMKELKVFESALDAKVAALPILALPIRPVLLSLHLALHSLFHGGGPGKEGTNALGGYSLAGRLGYLAKLLAKCPAEPTGADAADAFAAYADVDPQLSQTKLLLGYAHFCEIMPEVHRGYFSVGIADDGAFQLTHASAEFAASEATDILLSELAIPVLSAPPPVEPGAIARLAATAPRVDLTEQTRILGAYMHHFHKHVLEEPVVGDEGLVLVVGVGADVFARFRAVLMGISQFATDMALALKARLASDQGDADAVHAELLEWVSVHWTESFVMHLAKGLTGIDATVAERLFEYFSLDFRKAPPRVEHAGDGFFPPLARLPGGGLMIGPDLTQIFLQTRNAVYALQRLDPSRFDDLVSRHLEPALLDAAEVEFKKIGGLEICRSAHWAGGEIDMLVFEPHTNTALQIQAKAPLPPQGARMVARLQSRVEEGYKQLAAFRASGETTIDETVSRAIGRPVSGVAIGDALLARSCFGTHSVRSRAGCVALVSLPVLRALVDQHVRGGSHWNLSAFRAAVEAFVDALVRSAKPAWVSQPLDLDGTIIRVPMLQYDHRVIGRERLRIAALSRGGKPGAT